MTNDIEENTSFYPEIAKSAYYSLLEKLTANPGSGNYGDDQNPRQVTSGHYVEVTPSSLPDPLYIAHSSSLFSELSFKEELATSQDFLKFFSGDLQGAPKQIRTKGWATGYALSIMGRELYSQCPFRNGNGYGDGRAISILELKTSPIDSKESYFFGTRGNHRPQRWEFQLKGGGRTPYCRGGDGRAVLRSSVREFIVSEAMASLGVPTTRALSLIMSKSQKISRPWYMEGSRSEEPDIMVENAAAITTRVSSSFLRVGQIELFGRRARKNEHPSALKELEEIVRFAIENEYPEIELGSRSDFREEVLLFVEAFGRRLSKLVAHWIRIGFCQGNFNSDNCAVGGFTLDYGPFGLMEEFDPNYQPWTGGGIHYSFMQQPNAAAQNFKMLCVAVAPLLSEDGNHSQVELQKILQNFPNTMNSEIQSTFSKKMGLDKYDADLYESLMDTMTSTADVSVDWTIFWRKLSDIPKEGSELRDAFYYNVINGRKDDRTSTFSNAEAAWTKWLKKWNSILESQNTSNDLESVSRRMKEVNPKYVPREWMLVKAYRDAEETGDFREIYKLQELFNNNPYSEQSPEMEDKYFKKVSPEFRHMGGYSKMSCSS